MIYGKFWPRAAALLIDAIIIAPFSLLMSYFNFETFKSFNFFLFHTILFMAYKPVMESHYQATIGKMALGLKVTNLNFEQIALPQSLLRSIFSIAPSLIQIPFYYLAFNNSEIIDTDSFLTFVALAGVSYPLMSTLSSATSLASLIDVLIIFGDSDKKERTLHDRIAQTFVIKKDSISIGNEIEEIGKQQGF